MNSEQEINTALPQQLKSSEGFAIFSVLVLIMIITLVGMSSYMKIKSNFTHSEIEINNIKSGYVADAAIAWAITIANQDPAFTCATHKSDGKTAYSPSENGGPDCKALISFYPSFTV